MTARDVILSHDVGLKSQPPKLGVGHQRLNVFVGTWHTEGQQREGPIGPAASIRALETYEWLPGEFFLVHRFKGRVGDGEAECIEIIRYDAQSQSYPTHTFYNNGLANEWQSHERDGTWTLAGDWHMQGKSVKVRCTTAFTDAGHAMRRTWEQSCDGSSWETFWDVKSSKVP
jgi:Protein of unknown function (DUF1579)